MLRALYDYGKSHPDIVLPLYCKRKTLKYVVELKGDGSLSGFRLATDKESTAITPSVDNTNHMADVCIEKACVAIGLQGDIPDNKLASVRKKQKTFAERYQNSADLLPELKIMATALTNPAILGSIQMEAINRGVKSSDTIGFSISGRLLHENVHVRKWWVSVYEKTEDDPEYLDVITGEPCNPVRLFKPVSGKILVGGQSSGTYLISFNERAFESYGMTKRQGANCPMSQETADVIMDSLTHLADGAPYIAGIKFIHWYDKDLDGEDYIQTALVPLGDDIEETQNPNEENEKRKQADKLVLSPIEGKYPHELDRDSQYHILMLRPEGARIAIRSYMHGRYEDLYKNLRRWFCDMLLINRDGTGDVPFRSMNKLLSSLLTEREFHSNSGSKDRYSAIRPLVMPLMNACLYGYDLPNALAVRALNVFRSGIYGKGISSAAVQILKLWLSRKESWKIEDDKEKGERYMAELDSTMENKGYHCGCLMAIYERIQKEANPNVGNGVLQRYYSACMTSPCLAIARMSRLSVYHLQDISNESRHKVLEHMLEETYGNLTVVPKNMSIKDQAYFAVGYWHCRAELNKQLN